MSEKPAVELRHATTEDLAKDLDENLAKGRAFVMGAGGLSQRTPCELVIVHPVTGDQVRLAAEVVYVAAGVGLGLELVPFDDAVRAILDSLRTPAAEIMEELPGPPDDEEDPRLDDEMQPPQSLHERIRHLSLSEQQRLARSGNPTERTALERMYGPTVWEALLANPRLTLPEVARIARKGTLPKPLVEVIVAHNAWLITGEVQRALLTNPRCGGVSLTKVLRALSRNDLSRVPHQTAYTLAARDGAKKMLKGDE